jgi:hypothetical protein
VSSSPAAGDASCGGHVSGENIDDDVDGDL